MNKRRFRDLYSSGLILLVVASPCKAIAISDYSVSNIHFLF
jgi:hypothetical protein